MFISQGMYKFAKPHGGFITIFIRKKSLLGACAGTIGIAEKPRGNIEGLCSSLLFIAWPMADRVGSSFSSHGLWQTSGKLRYRQ